jgi:hypothetical protein
LAARRHLRSIESTLAAAQVRGYLSAEAAEELRQRALAALDEYEGVSQAATYRRLKAIEQVILEMVAGVHGLRVQGRAAIRG